MIEKFAERDYYNRRLNSYEQSWEMLNQEFCAWFSSRVVKIKGKLDPEIIKHSLSVLQKLHPRLSSQIIGVDDDWQFKFGKVVIPVLCVDNKSIEKEIIKQINIKIDSSTALMRIVMINNTDIPEHCHLMLIYHHAIGDGISVLALLEELFTYYQKIKESKSFEVIPNQVELLPIEEFVPNEIVEITSTDDDNCDFAILPFEQNIPLKKRRSGFILKSLDSNFTKQVITASKDRKVSVQGMLNAALVMALGKKIQIVTPKTITNHTISCDVYVNLRPFLKNLPQKITLNSFISAVTVYHTILLQDQEDDAFFWKIARDSKKQITDKINDFANLFARLKTAKEYVNDLLQSENEVDISTSISNLRVNIRSIYGDIELEDIYPVSPQGPFRYLQVYVSTYRDKMHITFCYSEPSHSRELIDDIANSFVSTLISACL
jgi:NRPS condensation-like uncharacterized protein